MSAELSDESHARLVWYLMFLLYGMVSLRYWALRHVKCKILSPRGVSSICIFLTVCATTALAGMVTWNLVGPLRGAVLANINSMNHVDPQTTSLGDLTGLNAHHNPGTINDPAKKPRYSNSTKLNTTKTAMETAAPLLRTRSEKIADSSSSKTALTASIIDPNSLPSSLVADDNTNNTGSLPPADILSMISKADLTAAGLENIDLSKLDASEIKVGTFTAPYNDDEIALVYKMNFAAMAVFYLAIWLVKASFVVIYFEFAWELSERTRRLLYISFIVIVVSFVLVMMIHTLWCLPMDQNWDMVILMQPRSCRSELAPSVINSVINVITDLLLMFAGIAIILSINLSHLNRGGLRAASLVITIAALTVLAATIRMICLIITMEREKARVNAAALNTGGVQVSDFHVPLQESIEGYPEIEAILATMASCLPAMRVFFRDQIGNSISHETSTAVNLKRCEFIEMKNKETASDISTLV